MYLMLSRAAEAKRGIFPDEISCRERKEKDDTKGGF